MGHTTQALKVIALCYSLTHTINAVNGPITVKTEF